MTDISIEQESKWEAALYALEWVEAILIKYKYFLIEQGDSNEAQKVSLYLKKLYSLEDNLEISDLEKIEEVNKKFWQLIKVHSEDERNYLEKCASKAYEVFLKV